MQDQRFLQIGDCLGCMTRAASHVGGQQEIVHFTETSRSCLLAHHPVCSVKVAPLSERAPVHFDGRGRWHGWRLERRRLPLGERRPGRLDRRKTPSLTWIQDLLPALPVNAHPATLHLDLRALALSGDRESRAQHQHGHAPCAHAEFALLVGRYVEVGAASDQLQFHQVGRDRLGHQAAVRAERSHDRTVAQAERHLGSYPRHGHGRFVAGAQRPEGPGEQAQQPCQRAQRHSPRPTAAQPCV